MSRRRAATGLLMATVTMTAFGETLLDADFGNATQPASGIRSDANPRVTGNLPMGWVDDSVWAQVWIDYQQMEEEGLKYLRINVPRLDDGRAQLACPSIPDATAEALYRLKFRLRNHTDHAVEIGLRMDGEPWLFYWSVSDRFGGEWDEYRYEFRMARNTQPMGVWINLSAPGMVDIGRLTLERLSEEDVVAEIKATYPDGGPANLFRNSRFPLGLQNGWALDRDTSDTDDVTIGRATDIHGPSGHPPLRISAPDGGSLLAEPFGVVYPVVAHRLCFSARGSGDWKARVAIAGHTVAEKQFTPSDDWQRIALSFSPKLGNPCYEFRLAGTGELLLDALQAGPATKTGRYVSAGECEVALAVPDSDASCARIQFDDDPATVRTCVTGDTAGATLNFKVVNMYGDEKRLAPVALEDNGSENGVADFAVFPDRPFGAFRIEAWAERDGKRVSPMNELIVYRLRRPRFWGKDASESPFGIHTNSTTRHNTMAKAVGINWVRLHDAGLAYIGWWNLETARGKWRFFDKELHRYRKHHLKILAELGTAPPWASYYADTGLKSFGYFDKFFQPKDLADYANYVKVVTQRYRGVIDTFDVWNEPWIHAWWGVAFDHEKGGREGYITSREPQKDFVRLMQVARDTAKATDPSNTVLGFNSTTGRGDAPTRFAGDVWTQGVLDNGGMDHCDVVCYHCYTGGGVGYPGDSVEDGLAVAVGPIRGKHGAVPKPIWMTEGSPINSRQANGMYNHTLPYRSRDAFADSADRLARYLLSMLANGVSRVFLYSMHGHGAYLQEPKQWNCMTTDDGSLHPCGVGHSVFAWHVEGTRFVERLDTRDALYAYLFESDDRAVAVLSSNGKVDGYRIPQHEGVTACDLFGNRLPESAEFDGKLVYLSARQADTLRAILQPQP